MSCDFVKIACFLIQLSTQCCEGLAKVQKMSFITCASMTDFTGPLYWFWSLCIYQSPLLVEGIHISVKCVFRWWTYCSVQNQLHQATTSSWESGNLCIDFWSPSMKPYHIPLHVVGEDYICTENYLYHKRLAPGIDLASKSVYIHCWKPPVTLILLRGPALCWLLCLSPLTTHSNLNNYSFKSRIRYLHWATCNFISIKGKFTGFGS